MNPYERLYDESEQARVRFFGFISENCRYDFGIVYTRMFFGKPLVVCMQTGRSTLLSGEDLDNLEYIQNVFNLSSRKESQEVSVFLSNNLPEVTVQPEAE